MILKFTAFNNKSNVLLATLLLFCGVILHARQNEDVSSLKTGAERTEEYIPFLKEKKVALYANHTGVVGDRHTLDILLDSGINVLAVLCPEHGFRGEADSGESIEHDFDERTGVPVISLYKPQDKGKVQNLIDSVDIVVTDIQDVGLRYYTYHITMIDLMETAIDKGKEFMVLDRPNPNGMYVDGPILDMKYKSGVGRLPIPIVHGMTLGELALMANGEGWLKGEGRVNLTVVPCEGYDHRTRYRLPVNPSPNLRSMKAVYMYPSMCYFSGTIISFGKGTDWPFLVYGHPEMKNHDFYFIPQPNDVVKEPRLMNEKCYGSDLRGIDDEAAIAQQINLGYLIDAYNSMGKGDDFFTSYFELLIGRGDIREKIKDGWTADQIKATWQGDVDYFKKQRRPYLLYAE